MDCIDRFNELGPDLEINLNYIVGLGWYGWASVYVGGLDGGDVVATLDATYAFDHDMAELDSFLNDLYEALAKMVANERLRLAGELS